MRRALLVVAALMAALPARAGTALPFYDVAGGCRYRIRYLSAGPVHECLRIELQSYYALKSRWPALSDAERAQIVWYGERQHVRSYIPFENYLRVIDQQRLMLRELEDQRRALAGEY